MIHSAVIGYGNLGRSVEKVITSQLDMGLVSVSSRRGSLDTETRVFPAAGVEKYKDEVDMLFVYLGLVVDILEQTPDLTKNFTTVDIYDNRREIPKHHTVMEAATRGDNDTAVILIGRDLGLFSLNRVLDAAILPGADQMTFWGPGLSQGHSDAVCRVPGVKKGVQYAKPDPEAIKAAEKGEGADLKGNKYHLRHCFIVAEEVGNVSEDAKLEEQIRETIVIMPDHFAPYETIMGFTSEGEPDYNHQGMPHGGQAITRDQVSTSGHVIELGLDLDRNPDFTAVIQVAYDRTAYRLKQAGKSGTRTVFEIALHLLSAEPLDDLVAQRLQ